MNTHWLVTINASPGRHGDINPIGRFYAVSKSAEKPSDDDLMRAAGFCRIRDGRVLQFDSHPVTAFDKLPVQPSHKGAGAEIWFLDGPDQIHTD